MPEPNLVSVAQFLKPVGRSGDFHSAAPVATGRASLNASGDASRVYDSGWQPESSDSAPASTRLAAQCGEQQTLFLIITYVNRGRPASSRTSPGLWGGGLEAIQSSEVGPTFPNSVLEIAQPFPLLDSSETQRVPARPFGGVLAISSLQQALAGHEVRRLSTAPDCVGEACTSALSTPRYHTVTAHIRAPMTRRPSPKSIGHTMAIICRTKQTSSLNSELHPNCSRCNQDYATD